MAANQLQGSPPHRLTYLALFGQIQKLIHNQVVFLAIKKIIDSISKQYVIQTLNYIFRIKRKITI